MKTAIKLMAVMLALLASLQSRAYDFESDGIYYNILSEDDRTVEVTCKVQEYIGGIIPIHSPSYFNDIIEIPQRVIYESTTYKVIGIDNYAFFTCKAIKSVNIPSSVTKIGNYAFYECSSLTAIDIPNAVTEIGEGAFHGCSSLATIDIPSAVMEIGIEAFGYCSALESINVDSDNIAYSSIEGILYNKDQSILWGCPGAKKEVSIPNSVTSIETSAFSGCTSLIIVHIPSSVTEIRSYAFCDCPSLTTINIPNSVTFIGDYAFGDGDTSALKTIYNQCLTPIKCRPDFSAKVLRNATLYVPIGTLEAYEKVDPWRNFWNIQEMEFSGINDVEDGSEAGLKVTVNGGEIIVEGVGDNENVTIYDMTGRVVHGSAGRTTVNLAPGIYIVKAGKHTQKVAI